MSDYPTHRPLVIEVVSKMLEATVKELQKPTNFAWVLNQQIEKEVENAMLEKKTRSKGETTSLKESNSSQSETRTWESCRKKWAKP